MRKATNHFTTHAVTRRGVNLESLPSPELRRRKARADAIVERMIHAVIAARGAEISLLDLHRPDALPMSVKLESLPTPELQKRKEQLDAIVRCSIEQEKAERRCWDLMQRSDAIEALLQKRRQQIRLVGY